MSYLFPQEIPIISCHKSSAACPEADILSGVGHARNLYPYQQPPEHGKRSLIAQPFSTLNKAVANSLSLISKSSNVTAVRTGEVISKHHFRGHSQQAARHRGMEGAGARARAQQLQEKEGGETGKPQLPKKPMR